MSDRVKQPRLWLIAALSALVFGFAMALVKGTDGGLRGEIGNLSAPWLLVAFLPGTRVRGLLRGATIGLCSTMIALAGFYVGVALQTPSSTLHEILRMNDFYFAAGLLSGPVLGTLGAAVGSYRRSLIGPVAALLMIGEWLVVWVLVNDFDGRTPWGFYWGPGADRFDWTPYTVQAALAALLLAVVVLRRPRRITRG
ncbi:DUF6518 family protein [Branchiibius cervicis]|uniref:DUF6518 family protein n=1 Tax=Branchiibius cervicis TaxID=908252 RepID=A0ABW2AY22_9MICO